MDLKSQKSLNRKYFLTIKYIFFSPLFKLTLCGKEIYNYLNGYVISLEIAYVQTKLL